MKGAVDLAIFGVFAVVLIQVIFSMKRNIDLFELLDYALLNPANHFIVLGAAIAGILSGGDRRARVVALVGIGVVVYFALTPISVDYFILVALLAPSVGALIGTKLKKPKEET